MTGTQSPIYTQLAVLNSPDLLPFSIGRMVRTIYAPVSSSVNRSVKVSGKPSFDQTAPPPYRITHRSGSEESDVALASAVALASVVAPDAPPTFMKATWLSSQPLVLTSFNKSVTVLSKPDCAT